MNASPNSLIATAKQEFESIYGMMPARVAIAPGRVNIIGEHTDYTQGLAMPMAIDRWTVIVGADDPGSACWRLSSDAFERKMKLDCTVDINPNGDATDYARGVIAGYKEYLATTSSELPVGQAIHCLTNIPIGAGLSSSASFSVALSTYIEDLMELDQSAERRIAISRTAEHQFAGVPCGIMDQFAVTHSKANHILQLDCRNQDAEPVALKSSVKNSGDDVTWLVIHSGASHQLSDGNYAARFNECQAAETQLGRSLRDCSPEDTKTIDDLAVRKRAQHVTSENQRVEQFSQLLPLGQWQALGELINQSHDSLRDDFQSSCIEADQLVAIASNTDGVYGARITGGGFGGAVIIMMDARRSAAAAQSIIDQYREHTGIKAEHWTVRPVDGASIVSK